MFHRDDASVHKASCMKTWFARVGMEELEYLAQSPEFNNTDHLWT